MIEPLHSEAHAAPSPRRIQRQRTKGWRMPEGAVYVGRPGRFGNPFNFRASHYCWIALSYGCRGDLRGRLEASVKAFWHWIDRAPERQEEQPKLVGPDGEINLGPRVAAGKPPSIEEIKRELAGKDLACWCPLDQPCHADLLLRIANS